MKKLALLLLTVSFFAGNSSFAQDTLPKFTLRNVGNNRIIIEWLNKFENVRQISIQRSFDSLKNFKTILTVSEPTLPNNGYMDTKATNGQMFYRLYIMMDRGMFLFSNSKRPVLDTIRVYASTDTLEQRGNNMNGMIRMDNPNLIQPISIDGAFNGPNVSSPNKTRAETWVPSRFVYTLKDGYVQISLPEEPDKKYRIKFYTLRDEFLFELKDVKERSFKIDKANFYQSGWFRFELFEDDVLKEKNRFYLPREF